MMLTKGWEDAWAAQLARTLKEMKRKQGETMGDDCENILSKLRRRDGEKRKCKLLDVGERAGRTLINILQESEGRSVFLGPTKDRALNKLQGYGPVELGEESGFYEHLVWQELTTNKHTP